MKKLNGFDEISGRERAGIYASVLQANVSI